MATFVLMTQLKIVIIFCICLSISTGTGLAQSSRSSIEDFSITITFAQPPVDPPIVKKAPLKYNKDFALILHMDDGNPAVNDQVMPFFKGQNGNPGLFFTEGNTQNNQPFKMDAVHFSFAANGVDIHNYVPGYLHWDNLINLWAGEFGIVNLGLTNPPQSDPDVEVLRNASYTKRKTLSGTVHGGYDMNVYVIPNNDISQLPAAKANNLAVYYEGISAIENPQRVEDLPSISGIEISRSSITNNLFQQVQTIASQSGPDNHFIATYFNHGFGGVDITFDQFKTQMNQIASTYGRDGLNSIWSASSAEVFEYLRIKESVTVNTNLNENVLTITFSGQNIPENFRYYALSLTVEGESNIVDLVVQQPDNISTYLFTQNKALVNLKWNGRVIEDALQRATTKVVEAEQQPVASIALVAMDYVQMLPDGDEKEQLRERLCALPGIVYEQGFCRAPEFLGPDTAYCFGNSVIFIAPEAASYFWHTGATTQSITLTIDEPMEVWARVTDNTGFVISDTVAVGVLPVPDVIVSPLQSIIDPGTSVQLNATGALTYNWSNGSTGSQIIVSPVLTTIYWVDGTNAEGCISRAEAEVEVVYTTEVDFLHNIVCFGDTTHLMAQVTTNDSVLTTDWDLTGDGMFTDETGDSIHIVFDQPGEWLIGLRIKTRSGALHTVYHSVIIADYPIAGFGVNGFCLEQPAIFTDESTVSFGTIDSWEWAVGDGNLFGEQSFEYMYDISGLYEVNLVVISNYGCSDTTAAEIQISPLPLIDLRLEDGTIVQEGVEVNLANGSSLTFKVESVYDSILWIGSINTGTLRVINSGNFYVDVFKNGCSNRRNFAVKDSGGGPTTAIVGVMNLITPNGDGFNDLWLIEDIDKISPARVAVYTRSGGLVFQSNDYKNDWDGYYNGNPLPEGTYYYVIESVGIIAIKGPLSIIR
ncbi:MAG: hypothetical protein CVT92_02775 [Bacteroidetes bacterium HGW-Bacteroidetes-1]|jgi:gliding motility-associated-like protein|nr:MAG: hypothetical protein CVT92_02775 [Bacteroidetes bacterium HGW-Bacteroidetes-1]